MISKLEAQECLKAFYNSNHEAEQLARLKKLSSDLSTIGQLLIQAGPAWEKLQKEQRGRGWFRKEPLSQLEKLNSKNRLRSEEHTSELQSQSNLVCRLL